MQLVEQKVWMEGTNLLESSESVWMIYALSFLVDCIALVQFCDCS